MPAYATFRNEAKGNFKNAFRTLEFVDFDLLVLQGPLLNRNFGNVWLDSLRRLAAQGKRWAILSGAFRSYTSEEVAVAREVIDQVPPVFISTRDSVSFKMLEGVSVPLRQGIDSAFFLPEAHEPPTSREPALVLCYDHFGEPSLVPDPAGVVSLGPHRYRLEADGRADQMATKSKAHAIAYSAVSRFKSRPAELAGHVVIRPDHRTNPHLPIKIYRDPNGMASDEPWTYIAVYANSSLTLSDRVHACVATLAYGGQAMLHNPTTKRSALFEDVGAGSISERPTRLDESLRAEQYEMTVKYLSEFVAP
jgi:polysaccharide pyruvyl transferase WcaK-like protein